VTVNGDRAVLSGAGPTTALQLTSTTPQQPPHGGQLVQRWITTEEAEARVRAGASIRISAAEAAALVRHGDEGVAQQ